MCGSPIRSVNTPNDDAIVLKGTHALGFARATENVTITNSLVSGYDIGSLLDGTYKRTVKQAPDRDGPTGRIKIGTESEGDFRNITISNVVFDRSRGLALESVDGAHIEDIAISNITMREISNAPIFMRLGSRMRAPEGTRDRRRSAGSASATWWCTMPIRGTGRFISGIPGHDIEDVKLSDIRILYRGGLTLDQVAKQPADLVNTFFFRATGGVPPREPYDTPEREKEYPEPSMFGMLPAYGFFIRHATGNRIEQRRSGVHEGRPPAGFRAGFREGGRFSACQGAEGRRRAGDRAAQRRGFFGAWLATDARYSLGEGRAEGNVALKFTINKVSAAALAGVYSIQSL